MWIRTEAFHVSKRGHRENEYEDAFCPGACACELSNFRCAVADGASESSFSGLWANLLVRGFVKRRLRLQRLGRVWQRAVGDRGTRGGGDGAAGKKQPWYVQHKTAQGAHAAFLGLSLRDGRRGGGGGAGASGNGETKKKAPAKRTPRKTSKKPAAAAAAAGAGTWRALAVGDSCVFQVREGALVAAGPLAKSDLFGNNPFLVGSKTTMALRRGDEHVTVMTGAWQPGDVFYLATDALAQWLLAEQEAGRPPWALLRALGPQTFAALVLALREDGRITNDDTTLMRVEVA